MKTSYGVLGDNEVTTERTYTFCNSLKSVAYLPKSTFLKEELQNICVREKIFKAWLRKSLLKQN